MKRLRTALAGLLLVLVGGLVVGQTATAAEPEEIMGDASDVLDSFVKIPEGGVPDVLLRKAYGIAIIPGVLKVGFLGGINYGQGVMSVRTEDGRWSKPTFVRLYGGSFGFQAGVSSTDLILVFKTKRSVRRLASGDFTLGGDASVAAGPVGRSTGANTNWRFNSEIYSYARARGLFAGVAINGARLGIAKGSNETYYEEPDIHAQSLLTDTNDASLPPSGRGFINRLNEYMPSSDRHYDDSADEPEGVEADKAEPAADEDWDNGQTQPYNRGEDSQMTVQAQESENDAADEVRDSDPDEDDASTDDEAESGESATTEKAEDEDSEAKAQSVDTDHDEAAPEDAVDETGDSAGDRDYGAPADDGDESAEPAGADEAAESEPAADQTDDTDDEGEDVWDYGASANDDAESAEPAGADEAAESEPAADQTDDTDDEGEDVWDYGASADDGDGSAEPAESESETDQSDEDDGEDDDIWDYGASGGS